MSTSTIEISPIDAITNTENRAINIAHSLDKLKSATDDESDLTEISVYAQIIYGVMMLLAGAKAKIQHGIGRDEMFDDTLSSSNQTLNEVQREVTAAMTKMSLNKMSKTS